VRKDFILISHVAAEAAAIIYPQFRRALADEGLRPTCLRLLVSAIDTFGGAAHLARSGYRRQYGILSRHVVETLATVLHLLSEPNALDQLHAGQLQSSKSITVAKRVLPHFGELYGMLSQTFVHVGRMQTSVEPLVTYRDDDEALGYIMPDMKHLIWLVYATAELTCLDTVGQPRYWHKVVMDKSDSNLPPELEAVIYAPTPAGQRWIEWLMPDPDMPNEHSG
jgi:hypothetical protein